MCDDEEKAVSEDEEKAGSEDEGCDDEEKAGSEDEGSCEESGEEITVKIPFIPSVTQVKKAATTCIDYPCYWAIGIVVVVILGVGLYFVLTEFVLTDADKRKITNIDKIKFEIDAKNPKVTTKKPSAATGKASATTTKPAVKSPVAAGAVPGGVKKDPGPASLIKPSTVKSPIAAAATTTKPGAAKPPGKVITPRADTTLRRVTTTTTRRTAAAAG